MLLLRLWNYLRGYVIILVDGYFVEKFINICTRRQILLWDVKVQSGQLVTMKMSINGFRLVRPIARKTKCRVRLLKKTGLPFVFNRYRRRKAFFAGAAIFIAAIYVLTSFVWSVEINGNKDIESSKVEKVLAENGIRSGVLKYRINTDNAVAGIMLQMKEVTWASIVVKGTKVKVELRERVKTPEIVPMDTPCDIVAVKDGIIKRVIAKEGMEVVGEGDTVKEGQVLITGKIPLKGEENKYRMVHAMGTVPARTWYEERVPVKLAEIQKIRTGKVLKNHSLILLSWKIDFFHRKPSYKQYTNEIQDKKLSVGEDLVFPVEWVTSSYYEERLVNATVSEKYAKDAAAAEAYKKLKEQLPENVQIIKKDIQFVGEETGMTAVVTLECIEDIGTAKRIGGN